MVLGSVSSEPPVLGIQDGKLLVSVLPSDAGNELWSIALASVYEKAIASLSLKTIN